MKKKCLLMVLSVLMSLSMFCGITFFAGCGKNPSKNPDDGIETPVEGDKKFDEATLWINHAASDFAGGEGTKSKPYLISSPAQLALFAKRVQESCSAGEECYELTTSFDMSTYQWFPVGYGEGVHHYESETIPEMTYPNHKPEHTIEYAIPGENSFKGTFNGNGKTITGIRLTLQRGNLDTFMPKLFNKRHDIGFFANVGRNAKIENLNLHVSYTFLGKSGTSLRAGENANIGGLAGYASGGVTINRVNVYTSIEIKREKGEYCLFSENQKYGGMFGYANDVQINSSLSNCEIIYYSDPESNRAEKSNILIGGFAAYGEELVFDKCESAFSCGFSNATDLSAEKKKDKVDIAGLTIGGYVGDSSGCQFINCTSRNGRPQTPAIWQLGYINPTKGSSLGDIGGYIGYSYGGDSIKGCINDIDINVGDASYFYIGGFIGVVPYSSKIVKITSSINTAFIDASSLTSTDDKKFGSEGVVGGICGGAYSSEITDCANYGKLTISSELVAAGILAESVSCTVYRCINYEAFKTGSTETAGLVQAFVDTTISDCINYDMNLSAVGTQHDSNNVSYCYNMDQYDFNSVSAKEWSSSSGFAGKIARNYNSININKSIWTYSYAARNFISSDCPAIMIPFMLLNKVNIESYVKINKLTEGVDENGSATYLYESLDSVKSKDEFVTYYYQEDMDKFEKINKSKEDEGYCSYYIRGMSDSLILRLELYNGNYRDSNFDSKNPNPDSGVKAEYMLKDCQVRGLEKVSGIFDGAEGKFLYYEVYGLPYCFKDEDITLDFTYNNYARTSNSFNCNNKYEEIVNPDLYLADFVNDSMEYKVKDFYYGSNSCSVSISNVPVGFYVIAEYIKSDENFQFDIINNSENEKEISVTYSNIFKNTFSNEYGKDINGRKVGYEYVFTRLKAVVYECDIITEWDDSISKKMYLEKDSKITLDNSINDKLFEFGYVYEFNIIYTPEDSYGISYIDRNYAKYKWHPVKNSSIDFVYNDIVNVYINHHIKQGNAQGDQYPGKQIIKINISSSEMKYNISFKEEFNKFDDSTNYIKNTEALQGDDYVGGDVLENISINKGDSTDNTKINNRNINNIDRWDTIAVSLSCVNKFYRYDKMYLEDYLDTVIEEISSGNVNIDFNSLCEQFEQKNELFDKDDFEAVPQIDIVVRFSLKKYKLKTEAKELISSPNTDIGIIKSLSSNVMTDNELNNFNKDYRYFYGQPITIEAPIMNGYTFVGFFNKNDKFITKGNLVDGKYSFNYEHVFTKKNDPSNKLEPILEYDSTSNTYKLNLDNESLKREKGNPEVVEYPDYDINIRAYYKKHNISEGTPTLENKVYYVSSENDLIWLSQQVANGNNFEGYVFNQTCDINMTYSYFDPIGDEFTHFSGVYNGNNHLIYNLNVSYDRNSIITLESDEDKINNMVNYLSYRGMFGYTSNAIIKNITILNSVVSGYSYVGQVVGYAENTKLENVNLHNCQLRIFDLDYSTFYDGWRNLTSEDINIELNLGIERTSFGGIVGKGENVILTRCSNRSEEVSIVYENEDQEADRIKNISGLVGLINSSQIYTAINESFFDGGVKGLESLVSNFSALANIGLNNTIIDNYVTYVYSIKYTVPEDAATIEGIEPEYKYYDGQGGNIPLGNSAEETFNQLDETEKTKWQVWNGKLVLKAFYW